jgi:hypothetical protein
VAGCCWVPLDVLANGEPLRTRLVLHNKKLVEDPHCGEIEVECQWTYRLPR